MRATARDKLAADLAALRDAGLPMVCALRLALWGCTALWVPVLLWPGETTALTPNFAFVRVAAAWLGVPRLLWVAPAALLVALCAGGLAGFTVVDYLWGGSRRSPARVYLAGVGWTMLAVGYLLATPIAYGTWLFTGFALVHWWIVGRVRGGRG